MCLSLHFLLTSGQPGKSETYLEAIRKNIEWLKKHNKEEGKDGETCPHIQQQMRGNLDVILVCLPNDQYMQNLESLNCFVEHREPELRGTFSFGKRCVLTAVDHRSEVTQQRRENLKPLLFAMICILKASGTLSRDAPLQSS